MESKLNSTFWVVPGENFREQRNVWKGSPGVVLTIYTNDPGENLVNEYNALEFGVVGQWPATKYIEINWTDWKV